MNKISVKRHLSERELETLIRKEKDKRFLERLIFVRDICEGESVEKAVRRLGRVKQTGYNWLERWNAGGLQGLKPDFAKGGRPSKLSAVERRELEEILRKRDGWTTREVRNLILKRYGVLYSLKSVKRILRSWGMKYCKPYPRDYRRPKDAEERLTNRVNEALKRGERFILGFLDECSPQTDSNTQRVWSFIKPEIRKNTTRYKANTFGFYAPAGESLIDFKENSRKEKVCEFLEEIREKNSKESILMVLDNFTSHRAKTTQVKTGELDIRLVYLPPYSPDLNPIDQIWRGLKRQISTAFFRTRDGFLNLIKQVYNQLSKKTSYAEGWIQKFLPEQSKQFHPILYLEKEAKQNLFFEVRCSEASEFEKRFRELRNRLTEQPRFGDKEIFLEKLTLPPDLSSEKSIIPPDLGYSVVPSEPESGPSSEKEAVEQRVSGTRFSEGVSEPETPAQRN